MANVKISQLPSATTPLGGTEVLPIVQSGATKKVTVAGLFTSPVMVTPTLGTPASGTATNLTGLPLTTGVTGILPVANGGNGTATPSLVAGSNVTITGTWPNQTIASTGGGGGGVTSFSAGTTGLTPATATTGAVTLAGTLAVANGGTGTATPSLVAGTNVSITGTWPNQTINSSGGGGGMVYPGAGIPLSTGSAWGTSYNSTGTGDVVLSTSPTLVTPLLGTPTSGNFSTGTFTWPTFNQNTTGTAANITASSNSTLTTLSALSLPGSQVSGNISGNAANVTGTVAIANGGTGQTTAAAAITALTGTQTVGQYLRSDGTNAALAAIQPGDVPTLNQNTTGTAANVTGIVAVANGGSGTATPALVAGTNVTITGSWPNQTINSTGGGGSPGGSTTQVQYNNAGAFGGITNATSDGTTLTLTSPVITQNIQVISGNTTAVRSRTYVLTATLTLDLPASPAAGDMVMFSNRSATATPVIGRNGQNIMGLAENMTVDSVNYFGTLVYADATRGWIFQ